MNHIILVQPVGIVILPVRFVSAKELVTPCALLAPAQANGTMSIGIWGANPSSQVGNIFGGSTPTLFKGGSNIQTQISFFTATLVYKTS